MELNMLERGSHNFVGGINVYVLFDVQDFLMQTLSG
jgi:hypothetical protein